MRLKSLELQGYKSFAAKSHFEFDDGITAIVGPNGSGKSNVSDAVRWVLGEQSYSALRGKKTEDMIFSGSDGRARLGMAQATLVFDNSDGWLPIDFKEVTVTRRAFRDGQNEYLLNGSRVRLRDVNEVLAASGLSRRTYTHIGQGLVDAVLSLRAEERRAFFEEAAGTTLHNTRRAEALNRLSATQENLLRLNDIISEITPRLRYLQRQAERAANYHTIGEELKDHLRIWYGFQWGASQKRLQVARAQLQQSQRKLQEHRILADQIAADIEDLRSRHNRLRLQLGEWHLESSKLHKDAEVVQRDLAVGEERSRSISAQVEEIEAEIAPLEESRHSVAEKAREAQTTAEMLAEELKAANKYVTELNAQLSGLQSQREDILRRQSEAQKRSAALADRIARHEARLAQLDERRRQLADEASEAESNADDEAHILSEVVPRQDTLEAKIGAIVTQLGEIGAIRETHLASLRDTAEETAQLDEEISRQRQRLEALRARHDLLSKMQTEMSGYYEGVRNLLKPDTNLRGIIGTVTQVLSVPPELEVAVETALGGHLQDVIVDKWEDAETAIAYLKRTHGGRATLLPLDTIRPASRAQPPSDKGIRGVATDLVVCESRLQPIAEFLLGRTVIVDDLPLARQVLPSLRGGFQIVTLEGDLVRSGGSVSGGSVSRNKSSGGFLAREREWQELPDQIAQKESSLEETIGYKKRIKARQEDLQTELDTLASKQADLENARAAAERDLRAIQRDIERARQAQDWQKTLLERIEKQNAEIDQTERKLQDEAARWKQDQEESEESANDLADQAGAMATEPLLQQLSQAQAAQATVEGRYRSQRTILEGHLAHQEELVAQIKHKHQRITELRDEKQQLDVKLETLRQRGQTLNDAISVLADKIEPAESELSSLEERRHHQQKKETAQRQTLQHMESETGQLSLEFSRRQDEIKLLEREIADDLGLVEIEDSEDVISQPPLPLHPMISKLPKIDELPEGLEDTIRQLRAQLSRMGSVNLDAPKEYEETKARHEFLSQQMTDLEQAAADLKQVISELDRIMEDEFLRTFNAVAVEFKKFFRQMFNGGEAELVLTDPDRLTETGVDIVARPPGKRAQNLSMLSGGERSLTAAALIFSLLKTSPTPFCILDEVDAMLDEANVGRFRGALEELAQETQFVVITHNRRTVEAAGTIYGISMGEDSVSRIVSLKFNEAP
jgi:chromosome segregation protein